MSYYILDVTYINDTVVFVFSSSSKRMTFPFYNDKVTHSYVDITICKVIIFKVKHWSIHSVVSVVSYVNHP